MANVKFHHNSPDQFLFQTPEGITVNIPPGEDYVTSEETARFILEQVKSGGGTYTATDAPIQETFEVELPKKEEVVLPEDETDPGLKPFSQILSESEDGL